MTEWDVSKKLLKDYFKKAFESSGMEWTTEDDEEINKLLDLIRNGVKAEIRKEFTERNKIQRRHGSFKR